jgi:glycosyltransferase involved in cell wall biosynthesis
MPRPQPGDDPVALIVTPGYLPILGGMERECALLAQEFIRRGFRPVVITEQQGMDVPLRETMDGVEVVRIPSSLERSLALQLRVAARMAWLVLRHRGASFAVVRTMTLPALAVGLLKALRLIRFPTLVTAETGRDVSALRELPLYGVSRRLAGAHDRLNGLSQANVADLRAGGFPERKITAIPNGIDTSSWQRTATPERVERLLFLGRLDPEKGVFELVDAFARVQAGHPSLWLTFAGEGPARQELRSRVAEHGVDDAVEFAGRVEYEDLGDLFARTDCVVLPSYSEGMPLSILEAAAHHQVLVVSDVGDIRRLFGDRIHICPIRDAEGLAAVLERVVTESPRTDYEDIVDSVSIQTVAETMLDHLGAPTSGARAAT